MDIKKDDETEQSIGRLCITKGTAILQTLITAAAVVASIWILLVEFPTHLITEKTGFCETCVTTTSPVFLEYNANNLTAIFGECKLCHEETILYQMEAMPESKK